MSNNLPSSPGGDEPDPRLRVLSRSPLNAELPLESQGSVITPNHLFFHRNRFAQPDLSPLTWRLQVGGAVEQPLTLRYADLLKRPARTLTVTLECAGNGRSAFAPPADGEPGDYGAVGTAEWTGVRLADVLREAGVRAETREILFEGADAGKLDGRDGDTRFARSLPVDQALHRDTLIAYAMNGDPLPAAHGFPARLIVPGWYGVASVKWLTRIVALTEPFTGYFQRERYIIPADDGSPTPLTYVPPRSVIVSPADGQRVTAGRCVIRGLAWSGGGIVSAVDVSTDGGRTWRSARFTSRAEPHAWRAWEFAWDAPPGEHVLQSRATDEAGNTQPDVAPWNRLGYANNAIQALRLTCLELGDR